MAREIDRDVVDKCRKYIKESRDYTIVGFLEKHNLYIRAEETYNGIRLKCPFHPDRKPSLNIDVEKNVCNCLSCNRGGDYLKYTKLVLNELMGKSFTYYTYLDHLLQVDNMMRWAVGSPTVFKQTRRTLEEIRAKKIRVIKPKKETLVASYEDLFYKMKREGFMSPEAIKFAIVSLQDKRTPVDVYYALQGQSFDDLEGSLSDVSLFDLMGEDV